MVLWVRNSLLMLLGVVLALILGEGLVRLATMSQENYVIEMWRYANLLKEKSPDPDIGHQHIPNRSAKLQNVTIQINSLGMRGPEPDKTSMHRVAIVGDSIALGWGVEDKDSLRGQLKRELPADVDVVNAGIGNMNLNQSVTLWESIGKNLSADFLVALVTPRSTAQVMTQSPGWLVEHSELAALASTFIQQMLSGKFGKDALLDGYRKQWQSETGQMVLSQAFNQLKQIQDKTGSQIIIVSIPEMHDFNHYQFSFMDEITQKFAQQYHFDFINPLPMFQGAPTSSFWVSQNDIHLNKKALGIISDLVAEKITKELGDDQ
ncbi:hypothetical protein VR7878_02645 [Vibrio ruber DSM 16370]|uniref:SGNH hydrolase-type esterase domain-containing protein n=1 Tax=Vibrio ruber (strain DSM 16370 / JCM 11486 / BCRC 17186 / CECT 7878 / LMG 23124 / VR1) TaxID=1123498 RepID=A0A1R4LNP9_VIBR1|nr:hypothetical protein [Vibrio ruber]SJN58083.1 hypothetical protein VR7878_02645 [Vibrio ruber DSM 16370]